MLKLIGKIIKLKYKIFMNEEVNAIVEEIKSDVEKLETITATPEATGVIKVVNGTGAVQGVFNTKEEAVAFATETGFKVLEDVVEEATV